MEKEEKSKYNTLDFSKGLDFYETSFQKGYANTFKDAIKILYLVRGYTSQKNVRCFVKIIYNLFYKVALAKK
jgi:hypothetical protein